MASAAGLRPHADEDSPRDPDRLCTGGRGPVRADMPPESPPAAFEPRPGRIPTPFAANRDQYQSMSMARPEMSRGSRGFAADLRPFRQFFQLVDRPHQPGGIIRRERQDLHIAVPVDRRLLGLGFLEDAMKVAAAEAEGADGRAARMLRQAAARAAPRY